MGDMERRPAPLPARRREEMPLTVISEGDVLVGSEARVRADIEAHDLVIAGHVIGNVVVKGRLKLTTTGRLEGDAHVGSLIVQEGGVHFGLLNVYPDGLPERPQEAVAELALVARKPVASRTRPLAASVDRVKKMWGEIF